MLKREEILSEIRRVAADLGRTPGKRAFQDATGIRESDWSGRYWARWSDAVKEAGCTPNVLNPRKADPQAGEKLAREVRRLGRFPTGPEFQLRHREDPDFPNVETLRRRGGMDSVAALIRRFCDQAPADWQDVLNALPDPSDPPISADLAPASVRGYVYLVQSGRRYKIGYTTDVSRRLKQLNTGMPDAGKPIHIIPTDDPAGIEAYWHKRFAAKRVRPDAEWFTLSPEDVSAFRRRKFQ